MAHILTLIPEDVVKALAPRILTFSNYTDVNHFEVSNPKEIHSLLNGTIL